jgi:1-aminocyclopropane-1-carboxylate deaminase
MLIPEGGTNKLAIKGCEEIFNPTDIMFDYVCCCVGTGGTISGLINSSWPHQKILGFPALKGAYLNKDISKFARRKNWELIEDYHFGGYAKINEKLIHFMNNFKLKYDIQLDPVYTAKMIFGVNELINNGYFEKNAKILLIHSGGLQGIPGMNEKLRKKKLPLIN